MGEILDEAISYHYAGVPEVVAADVLELVAEAALRQPSYLARRPRLGQYTFSPYMRTPVHDLPHDGVGAFAMHQDEWLRTIKYLTASYDDMPAEVNLLEIYGVAVEEW